MKHLFLILIGLLFIPVNLLAQSIKETILEGIVVEDLSGIPLQQATVRVLSLPDSMLVKGTVSVSGGKFSLALRKKGLFLVSVSFIGFETATHKITLPASSGKINLGKIKLAENSLVLGEAVVEGKAPEIVLKEDTVEFNASSYKLPPSSMVEDLIKKLPGVEIDESGNITAGGKTISRILVDGKEFFGKDVKVATKNINVAILEKLQVIDRKSEEAQLTGVDDGDDEKVINLTIKKGMKNGWFGNAMGGYGNKDRFEGAAMVNRFVDEQQYSLIMGMNNTNNAGFSDLGSGMYSGSSMGGSSSGGMNQAGNVGTNFNIGQGEKIRFGGNVMFSGNNQSVGKVTDRENILTNRSTFYNQELHSFNRSRNFDSKFKLQWQLDSVTRLVFEPSFQYNTTNNSSHSTYSTQGQDSLYINRGDTKRHVEQNGYNYSARMTVSRSFKQKKGRRLSLSLQVNGTNNDGTSLQNSLTKYGDEENPKGGVRDTTIHQKQVETSDKLGFRVRLSYVEPFGNNRFLQAAYTINRNQTNSDRLAYNWMAQEEDYSTDFDSLYSDRFKNVFVTQNLNVNVRTVRKKYNYSIGLNVDPSYTKSLNFFDPDRSFDRSVVNLGPTGEFVYLWNKHHNLRFQYRGRTQQPSISQLQPSKNITNPLNIRVGNLDLNPSYQSNYSLRYSNYKPKSQRSLQANIEGRMVMNSIVNQVTYDSETGVQTTKPVNVNGVWNIRGMVMTNMPLPNKHFQFSNYMDGGYNQQIGFTNGQRNKSQTYNAKESLGIRFTSTFFDLGLRGNYSYSSSKNTVASKKDQTVMNYGGKANLSLYLPLNLTLSSDMSYNGNQGYSAALARSEWLWNVQAYMEFLKNKQATLFLRAYDLFHQRSTLSRRVTANYIEDVESDLLTNYFIAGVIIRFNSMGKHASRPNREMNPERSDGNRGRGAGEHRHDRF